MGIITKTHSMGSFSVLLLIIAAAAASSGPPDRASCKSGWFDASWINLGCLLFNSSTAMNWERANTYCQQDEDARLIEVKREDQFDFLRMELDLIDDHESRRHWWTSGTDIGREGNWAWMESFSYVESFIWYPGQPGGRYGENCLLLHHNHDYLGGDASCTSSYYPVCQKIN